MLYGKRGPRLGARRKPVRCLPKGEALETKVLLSLDLGGTAPPSLPTIAAGNVGVAMVNSTRALQNAGYSVANLGSVNNSGYDAMLIGAPAFNQQGTSTTSAAYLVFGSQAMTTTGPVAADWLNNTPDGRVGNLPQLGGVPQVNPISGSTTDSYNFNGVTFITSQQPNSRLGASVADAGVIRGTRAFLIGAPGGAAAGSFTSGVGTGRVYLVYGATNLGALADKTIDLDNPTQAAAAGVTVITFVSSGLNAQLGTSVAGIGNFLNDGSNAIALGAPSASISGTTTSGAVYVMTSNNLPNAPTVIDVAGIGQGTWAGLTIAGPTAGSEAGFAVGGSGMDVNGDGIADLVVGAPAMGGGAGAAFLVYGGNLTNQTVVTNGQRALSLARVGAASGSTPAPVAGAAIAGSTGENFGFAVAGAGDFNNDNIGDIIVGGPGYASDAGRAVLVYGARNNAVNGVFSADAMPAGVNSFTVVGTAAGDEAGYSVSAVAAVKRGQPNGILVGSPGFLADRGAAYYLPGHGGTYTGVHSLTQAEDPNSLAGLQLTATTPGFAIGTYPPRFGSSVSGRLLASGQRLTVDGDLLGDFIVGAPGFTIIQSGNLAGAGMIVEGAAITNLVGIPPASNVITTQIVQIDSSTTVPFSISAKTPDAMKIYVTATTTPSGLTFNPVTDIDPTTIVVNGVAFPDATVAADPANPNQAIITISPRSKLNLPAGLSTLTLGGFTVDTAPAPNEAWGATTQVNTGGGPTPQPGGEAVVIPPGVFIPATFNSHFGGAMTPTVAAMSRYSYAPIPLAVAMRQYLPQGGFRKRLQAYHGDKIQGRQTNSGRLEDSRGVWTLGSKVFTRGRFGNGKTAVWTHPGRVVPVQSKVQRYINNNRAKI